MILKTGIDIGSTTIKAVVINEENEIVYKTYLRHRSSITRSLMDILDTIKKEFNDDLMYFNFTGSAGMLLANSIKMHTSLKASFAATE